MVPQPETLSREGQPPDPSGGSQEPAQAQSPASVQSPAGNSTAFLEGQVAAVHRELQTLRQEVQSLITAVDMANEETQKVTSRMDQIENEWVVWAEAGPPGDHLNPEDLLAEVGGPPQGLPQQHVE